MFDFGKFLEEKFQSPIRLTRFMAAYGGLTPDVGAVRKWFQRGAIPAEWFPVILAFLEIEEGAPIRLARYLRQE